MIERGNERVAWFNGDFMPENQVRIPFRDLSWIYGDGCFDMTRSFNHKLFKVQEHVDRLYRSLKYLRIDPGMGPDRMMALTESDAPMNTKATIAPTKLRAIPKAIVANPNATTESRSVLPWCDPRYYINKEVIDFALPHCCMQVLSLECSSSIPLCVLPCSKGKILDQ